MTRPTKLTADSQKRIIDAIVLGATYEMAAQYGGVSYNTFNSWMLRACVELERLEYPHAQRNKDEDLYVSFYEAVKDAEGRAVVGWLGKIERSANDGNWQAAAWKLERRYPRDYGRTVHEQRIVNLTPADAEKLSTEDLDAELKRRGLL